MMSRAVREHNALCFPTYRRQDGWRARIASELMGERLARRRGRWATE